MAVLRKQRAGSVEHRAEIKGQGAESKEGEYLTRLSRKEIVGTALCGRLQVGQPQRVAPTAGNQ